MWNDNEIVDSVKQFPVIWRRQDMMFRNKLAKQNAWIAISKQLCKNVKDIQQRWATLRNRYATEIREEKFAPSGSAACAREWHLLEPMSFLKSQIVPRKTFGNIPIEEAFVKEDGAWSLEENNKESCFVEEFNGEETEKMKFESTPTTKIVEAIQSTSIRRNKVRKLQLQKRKAQGNDAVTRAFTSITKYLEKKEVSEEPGNDEDLLFGKMVGEGLKKIKRDKTKYLLKSKIMCLLAEAME